MICPTCGHDNPANAPVCAACATPLPSNIVTGGTQDENGQAPTYSPNLPKGVRLKNNAYAIGEVLGQGGFGITYKGGDLSLRRYVALKEFFPQGCVRQNNQVVPGGGLSAADYAGVKAKFIEEARTLARFSDPGIVRVFGVFEENNTAYMAMEFLEGSTLSKSISEVGVLDEAEAVSIAEKIGGALAVVHAAGLIHRDLKPDNICLTKDGRVVLIDFGTARAFASGKTVKQTTMLTPGYAPLEQYGQQARFGPYTDIYALAATLYHAVTGQVPPQATDRAAGVELKAPRELNPKLSKSLSEALVWAMQVKAAERPQNIEAFIGALTASADVTAPLPDDVSPITIAPAMPAPPAGWGASAGDAGAPVAQRWFYHVPVTGKQIGPLTRVAMNNLINSRIIRADTLVWHEGVGDWMPASQSDLADAIAAAPPPRAPQSAPQTALAPPQPTAFDRALAWVPGWVWLSIWLGILTFVVGRLGVGIARYRNGDADFGPQLAARLVRANISPPIRSARLKLSEPDFDTQFLVKRYDNYEGSARTADGDAADLELHVTSRDWLYRPDKFQYALQPTNFGPVMEAQIMRDLTARFASAGYAIRARKLHLSRLTRSEYRGAVEFYDDNRDQVVNTGTVVVDVQTFDDADGSPERWTFRVE